jgi:acylphosphatase
VATVHFEVVGKVQGVGFRWFVRETARRAGLAGWVCNREDGCVEVAASGSEGAIAELMAAARSGPPGARVERIADLPLGELEVLTQPFSVKR